MGSNEVGQSHYIISPYANYVLNLVIGAHLTNIIGENPQQLRPIPGYPREFIPFLSEDSSVPMYELIIPKHAPDVPGVEYTNGGDFMTSDVFQKVLADTGNRVRYIWKGRTDDWIKLSSAGKTDVM